MTYEITHEQRLALLEAYNKLRIALVTVGECQDLWMSDIRNLEKLEYTLHNILKFVPKQDAEGRRMYYVDWILNEEDGEDD